jgi:hypothetical protein
MTTPTPPPPSDETWTVGEAVAYLNAGGIDFGFTDKDVRRMADDPGNQVRLAVPRRPGRRPGWRRLLASTVRAERAQLLRAAGRDDPEWPVGRAAGPVGEG